MSVLIQAYGSALQAVPFAPSLQSGGFCLIGIRLVFAPDAGIDAWISNKV